MLQSIGWVATALFAVSYLFKRPSTLRAMQAIAALLWIIYGGFIHAVPVVVANLIVAGMAVFTRAESKGTSTAISTGGRS